ncbi:MAG: serine/threonine-protein kinase [Archangium sp.]|nr:serine/threonine-protein kinase [Archangium sp.]
MTHAPKLARYEVLGRLATGGMAEVWLARTVGIAGFEKLVVIKTILPNLAESPQFVSMFVNEARLAAMLSHPNCVQIFDLGQEGSCLYIAMEYLEGFSLARVLKRARLRGHPITEAVIARIIMDAASGLDYSHRLKDREGRHVGLVHRDVSPDNLLVGFSGQVKVVDFGIAKAATPALLSTATSAGMVKGKHGYIAPEYLLGLPLDGRADIFALGVVLYRALTGKRPFLGATEAAISMAVLSDVPRSPLELVPSLNPALATVVMMALEKEPAQRFESARAMRQAIEVAVVRAAENEEVADLMNTLWPPGDEERVALHALATGMSEETSSPVLHSVVSGTYPNTATPPRPEQLTAELPRPAPNPAAPVAPSPFIPSGVEGPPPAVPRAGSSNSYPAVSFDSTEQPAFEEPPASNRTWLVALAVVVLVAVAGLGVFFKDRRPQVAAAPAAPVEALLAVTPPPLPAGTGANGHLSVATPVMVKVFDGKQELGGTPLALDLTPGLHTLRLSNKGLGIDQTVLVTIEPGQTSTISELAKGLLVVKVEPWAYVKLDGKQLGQTPIPARQVYEGVHSLELSNTNLNETRRLEVKVKAGETRTVSINLEE